MDLRAELKQDLANGGWVLVFFGGHWGPASISLPNLKRVNQERGSRHASGYWGNNGEDPSEGAKVVYGLIENAWRNR